MTAPGIFRRRAVASQGILCMLAYLILFVAANAITKHLAASLPVVEIAYFRYALAIPVVFLVLRSRGETLRVQSFGAHVARGVLAAVGSICGYVAIAFMPLGDATVLFYAAPILVTAGAVVMLRERADLPTIACIAAGFVGVVMVAQPNFGSGGAVVAGISNAFCAAGGVLLVRRLRGTENPASLALSTSIVCAIGLFVPAQIGWSDPAYGTLLELAALGFIGGAATVLLNIAYSKAAASLLAGLDFLAVPVSMAVGALFWDQQPSVGVAAGCAVIIAAGLGNALRPHPADALGCETAGVRSRG